MSSTHLPFALVGGDDWEILATLLDENGAPYDLDNAEIKWALINALGQRTLDVGDTTIDVVDAAAGTCAIRVTAARSATVLGGTYSDALRIVTGNVTSTLCIGPIYVVTDPWMTAKAAAAAAEEAAPAAPPTPLRLVV
jgi:hypothetical protein